MAVQGSGFEDSIVLFSSLVLSGLSVCCFSWFVESSLVVGRIGLLAALRGRKILAKK